METVTLDELNIGDTILINGMDDHEIYIVTVAEITEDGLIVPEELGGLDYDPGSSYIVRVEPNLVVNDLR